MHHRPVIFSSLFICAAVSNASWRVRWKRLQHLELLTQQTLFCKVWLRSFASVDSPSIFLTLNPCRSCWKEGPYALRWQDLFGSAKHLDKSCLQQILICWSRTHLKKQNIFKITTIASVSHVEIFRSAYRKVIFNHREINDPMNCCLGVLLLVFFPFFLVLQAIQSAVEIVKRLAVIRLEQFISKKHIE